MPTEEQPRKIVGSVLQTGRIYGPGDEDALAKAMKGASVQHLLDKGVLSGDWGQGEQEAAEPGSEEAPPAGAETSEKTEAPAKSRRPAKAPARAAGRKK